MKTKFLLLFLVLIKHNEDVLGSKFKSRRAANDACGIPSQTTSLIIRGDDFQRGAWPWMVALLIKSSSPPKLFCGAVLVSQRKVLTAAHCLQNKDQNTRKRPRDVLMLFGAYDLDDLFQTGSLSGSPIQILIHPEWNPFNQRYDADIAALLMEDDVPYTKFIRPICLSQTELTATEGYVAGWGESEDKTKEHERLPKQIKTPILPNESCFIESIEFAALGSTRTICGGKKNGTFGPCRGDSGGGLYVKNGNVFYLKGLVSASLISLGQCDVTNFALYTNVDKFVDWILNPTEDLIVPKPPPTPKPSYAQLPSYSKPEYSKPNYGQQTSYQQKPSYSVAPSYGSRPNYQSSRATCGVMSSPTSLIQQGSPSSREQFPWTVAILLKQPSGTFLYFSTGSLISSKHIVTTGLSLAYLEERTQSYIARSNEDFRMYFGVNDMEGKSEIGSSFVDGVEAVLLNPNIKHGYPRIANIGVLQLKDPIQFNQYISPVCLPNSEIDLEEVEGRSAFAVGWGQDDTGSDSKVKKHVSVKIQSEISCLYFWRDYLKSTEAKKFFCAGGDGRKTACYRDQPLYLKSEGKWFIRGLISIAANREDGRCDAATPVLYEDVGQFYDWLKNIIK